jgi:hypothetical protein
MTTPINKKGKLTFQQVLEAARELSLSEQHRLQVELANFAQVYLLQPDKSTEAIQRGQRLAEKVRDELKGALTGSLDETMASLRGRLW